MLRLNTSPRVPSFWGPMLLAAALLLVSNFSEPYWQNFYIVQGKALNTTIKLGAWGACTSYRNATGINGPSTFCTSHYSGYDYYYVPNNTANGINQFPTVADDNTILGLNAASTDRIFVLGSGATSTYWVHAIATILTCLCVASLILSPKHLGSENSRLFALQKSGIVTIILALISFVVTLVAFCIEIAVALPAKNRLNNAADGITASLGNVQWFTLPCAIVMIPALLSVLLRATTQHEYVDL